MRPILIVVLAAASVTASAATSTSADAPVSQTGVWAMRGYGSIWDITASGIAYYDTTDVSCERTESETAEQANARYRVLGREGNELIVRENGGITDYALVKLPALPDRCRLRGDSRLRDPELNFWVMWHAFKENYAFFATHNVDWNRTAEGFRPRVSATTTDAELADVFSEMLLSLKDGHVAMQAGERELESGSPSELRALWQARHPSSTPAEGRKSMRAALNDYVSKKLLRGKGRSAGSGVLEWGWLADRVAYLNVASMYLVDEAQPDNDLPLPRSLEIIDAGMASALRDLRGAKAWVVDARWNNGGQDAIALRIMGYFTRERFRAFTKKAVDGPGFTRDQPVYVEPASRNPFLGPILYLQSGSTISAAEIFTLAMQARPNVTRIGTPTYGVFSDELGKTLPNGWTFSLSNEIYTAINGEVYEGRGVPPQIPVQIPTDIGFLERLRLDTDIALAEARKVR